MLPEPQEKLVTQAAEPIQGFAPKSKSAHSKIAFENYKKKFIYSVPLEFFDSPPAPLKGLAPSLLKMFDTALVQEGEKVSVRFKKDEMPTEVELSTKIWNPELNEFGKRCVLQAWLHYLFGDARSLDFEVEINDGSKGRIDLVVKKNGNISCLIEFTRDRIQLLDHRDQMVRYGTRRDNPSCPPFSMLLTDGDKFFVGFARWENYAPEIFFDNVDRAKSIREDYKIFWSVVAFEDEFEDEYNETNPLNLELFDGDRNVQVEIMEVLGKGSFSTVFLAQNIVNNSEIFALKFGDDLDNKMLRRELRLNRNIEAICGVDKVVLPAIGKIRFVNKLIAIAYPVASPVIKSSWIKADRVLELSLDHYRQLWHKLKSLHRAGVAHRDIRTDNIVIFEDQAYFIDLGCSCELGQMQTFSGSLITASQRILYLLYREGRDISFEYQIEDDYESFYKMFLWERFRMQLPNLSHKPTDKIEAGLYMKFWYGKCPFFNMEDKALPAKIEFIENTILGGPENSKPDSPLSAMERAVAILATSTESSDDSTANEGEPLEKRASTGYTPSKPTVKRTKSNLTANGLSKHLNNK